MPETNEQGLSKADNETAEDLYREHSLYSGALKHAEDIRDRAKIARAKVAKAQKNGTYEKLPYEIKELAGSDSTQRNMLRHAQLLYDANLWRAQQHKEKHLPEYIEQGVIDAKAKDDMDIDPDPDSTKRRSERENSDILEQTL